MPRACRHRPSVLPRYDTKSWIWQCCHELEYWQVWYDGAVRSSSLTFEYFTGQCAAAFGEGYPAADVAAFNEAYMGLAPDSTQVFASNGGDDPWRGCTLNATLRDSYPEETAMCTGCGHCGDLHGSDPSDPPELTNQRNLIAQYLNQWL